MWICGLSPRGRGKLDVNAIVGYRMRSIPAWAGETACSQAQRRIAAVYPRVGGGNLCSRQFAIRRRGLSPRGRGKPIKRCIDMMQSRSIPAWAGETTDDQPSALSTRVYPRVGGGNGADMRMPKCMPGLSPRGRGKLSAEPAAAVSVGSIPAWAGETEASRLVH